MPYGMSMQRKGIPLKQKNIPYCLKPPQSMPMTVFMEAYELKITPKMKDNNPIARRDFIKSAAVITSGSLGLSMIHNPIYA